MAASEKQRARQKRVLFQSLDEIQTNDYDVESASNLGKLIYCKPRNQPKKPATGLHAESLQKEESLLVSKFSADSEELSPRPCRSLFIGMQMLFLPPTMKKGLQWLRKEKAVEHGAVLAAKYSPKTTHILCDKTVSKMSLLTYLSPLALRKDVVVVNEAWMPQCVLHAHICDPREPKFRLEGDGDSPEEEQISKQSFYSIKKPSRHDQPEKTQESTTSKEESDIHSLETLDAFDEIIGQVKKSWATQKVVSAVLKEDDTDEGFLVKKIPSSWEASFVAAHPHTESTHTQNPNRATIEVLERMKEQYVAASDQWRCLGYRKAISTLKKTPYLVATEMQASRLPGIGDRIAAKIATIVETGRLQQLEDVVHDPRVRIKRMFIGIYGVGYAKASEWVACGYTTLDDILQHGNPTRTQRLGIEHSTDLNTRIPHNEVQESADFVYRKMKTLDSRMEIHVMGSFRRGASDCGDIDIIITRPGLQSDALPAVLNSLVKLLFSCGFLVAELMRSGGGTHWHGCSQLNHGLWRRIDFLFVPYHELGAALLYFTGNDIFNRSLRLLASKKGFRLNQKGLFKDVMRGPKRVKITEGTRIASRTEQSIFDALGLNWRPPSERVC